MAAEIIDLPKRNRGNGAREALIAIAESLPTTLERPGDAERWADWMLAELWARGFGVGPVDAA